MATSMTVPSAHRPSFRGRIALIAVLGLLALAYQARAITDIVRDLCTAAGGARVPFRTEFVAGRIAGVRDEAAAAGVQAGDRVVSVGGRP